MGKKKQLKAEIKELEMNSYYDYEHNEWSKERIKELEESNLILKAQVDFYKKEDIGTIQPLEIDIITVELLLKKWQEVPKFIHSDCYKAVVVNAKKLLNKMYNSSYYQKSI